VSRHPKNRLGVSQSSALDVGVLWTECEVDIEDESWQPPNQPRWWHEVLADPLIVVLAVVCGTVADDDGTAVTTVVVVASLQPNQPGVLQVVVVETDVELVLVLVVIVLVDDSSKHPHHPGVLQVSVRVFVE